MVLNESLTSLFRCAIWFVSLKFKRIFSHGAPDFIVSVPVAFDSNWLTINMLNFTCFMIQCKMFFVLGVGAWGLLFFFQ